MHSTFNNQRWTWGKIIIVALLTYWGFSTFLALAPNIHIQLGKHPTLLGDSDCGSNSATFNVSPDGHSIVFSAEGNGGKDLYMLDLASMKVSRLTNTPDYENFPAFSPDGKTIVFERAKDLNGPRYLWLMNLATKACSQLTSQTFTDDESPSFGHDGQQIIFERFSRFLYNTRGEDTWNDGDVYTIRPDRSRLHRLSHLNADSDLQPQTDTTERWFLYVTYQKDTNKQTIAAMPEFGMGAPRDIINFSYEDLDPFLFADGEHLVFVSDAKEQGKEYDLYIADLRSRGTPKCLNVYNHGNWASTPSVTADGKHIFFRLGYNMDLWEVNTDGTNAHEIADSSIFSDPTDWKPT